MVKATCLFAGALVVLLASAAGGCGSSSSPTGTGGLFSLGGVGKMAGSGSSSGSASGSSSGSGGSGGSGSSSGSASSQCTTTSTAPCGQCLAQKCCDAALACQGDSSCASIESRCAPSSSCPTSCQTCIQQAQNSLATDALSCVEANCASECMGGAVSSSGSSASSGNGTGGTKKIGDPCSADSECASGTCVNQLWCSTTCTSAADCGSNSAGIASGCDMASTGQMACYPGCAAGGDCSAFSGLTCQTPPGGTPVCSP